MRAFNALAGYPSTPRLVGNRTIRHRIVAAERGKEFFDGARAFGYGGMKYDGRWKSIAQNMCKEYRLDGSSHILQLNCEKGFLLHEFELLHPKMKITGTETSKYAREHAFYTFDNKLQNVEPTKLPYVSKQFHLVIALGVVYTLNLADAIKCLKEIKRVGVRSFITLGAYETEEDLKLFKSWSLLGTTILRKEEWIEVLESVNYNGDYHFVTAESLNLCAS